MFAFETRFFVVVTAIFLCAVTAFADVTILSARFIERRTGTGRDKAYLKGTLYYYFDSNDDSKCRLRFDYEVPNVGTVSNLYHYGDHALYSMCDKCSTSVLSEMADPWYVDWNVYEKQNDEGGYTWYKRKDVDKSSNGGYGAQISRILMNGSDRNSNKIKKIEFSDGRTVEIEGEVTHNPNGINEGSKEFKIRDGLNCPNATCNVFADLVFVLDNSGSVETGEINGVYKEDWKNQIDFVKGVMDTFEFGDNGVEAAVIQFNGPLNVQSDCKKAGACEKCVEDKPFPDYYTVPAENTASILAGLDQGHGMTVSPHVDVLKNTLTNGVRPQWGWTCQGYGLELAMQVLDASPRKSRNVNNIIIAVTDGEDQCPNRTARAAEKLRTQYKALVIEVGVGVGIFGPDTSECREYDSDFLKRIASKLAGTNNPAVFGADDYPNIKTVTDQLFKPICEVFNQECSPDCYGFCACGKCLCPSCDESSSFCSSITCDVGQDGTSSTGCVVKEKSCSNSKDACSVYKCDESKHECIQTPLDCEQSEKRKNNPGACRKIQCNPNMDGGCYIQPDDEYCRQHHASDQCVTYECAREGVQPDFDDGCRVKTNKTKEFEQNRGSKWCMTITCDPNSGKVTEITDPNTCNWYGPCFEGVCKPTQWGGYDCFQIPKNRGLESKCANYECRDNQWVETQHFDANYCVNKFQSEGKDLSCKNVYCDDNKGCVMEDIQGCSGDGCDYNMMKQCFEQAKSQSSVNKCILGSCKMDGWTPQCVVDESKAEDCTKTMAEEAERRNKDVNNTVECYNPACENGRCTVTAVKLSESGIQTNKCTMAKCEFNQNSKRWEWVSRKTPEAEECVSDECFTCTCDENSGVHWTNICTINTNECVTHTCEDGKCHKEKVKLIVGDCMEEKCDESVGKKYLVIKNVSEVCPTPDICHYAVCEEGNCTMKQKQPDIEKDPCYDYICDPKTGEFTPVPTQDDGLYCTENKCTVFGEWRFEPISCSKELEMSGFPCFEPRCKENAENKTYQCQRKLIPHAYVDICGNCIIESGETVGTSSSKSEANMLECTGAPAKPVLTEGLAAAAIALIVVGAVVLGAAIAASSVLGAKTLIERSKDAANQSAHSNPLYENGDNEMNNPAYQENQTV